MATDQPEIKNKDFFQKTGGEIRVGTVLNAATYDVLITDRIILPNRVPCINHKSKAPRTTQTASNRKL